MKKLLFSLLLLPLLTRAQIITTIAGNGTYGHSGDGGPATNAELEWPVGVAVDHSGNVYISDQDERIRKVNTFGIITTIAGNGASGYNGDGIAATDAMLFTPGEVAIDGSGNIYIPDAANNRIRKVNTAGIITTIAGDGTGGYAGDGGTATASELYLPAAVAVDNIGNVYIADGCNRIRKVDTFGIITTFAGNGYGYPTTGGFSGDGRPATAAEIYGPGDLKIGKSNDLSGIFIADDGNERIRLVNTSGTITTFAGGGTSGLGNGGPATAAEFLGLTGVATDHLGNVYIVDEPNSSVRVVNPSGIITTFAGNYTGGFSGDGGPATAAQLYQPYGIAVDDSGNVYIDDLTNNRIRKVSRGTTKVNIEPRSAYSFIDLYPNPVKGELTVSASGAINNITITNLLGQVVKTSPDLSKARPVDPFGRGEKVLRVDVSGMPAGVYFVRINGLEARKFVKY